MATEVIISKRLVLVNSLSAVIARVLNIGIQLWVVQYLLKRIAPEEYALYPVIVSLMAFLPLLTVVLTSGLGRFVVEAYAKGKEEQVTQIVTTMFFLLLAASLVVLVAGLLFVWNIGHILTIAPERL